MPTRLTRVGAWTLFCAAVILVVVIGFHLTRY